MKLEKIAINQQMNLAAIELLELIGDYSPSQDRIDSVESYLKGFFRSAVVTSRRIFVFQNGSV